MSSVKFHPGKQIDANIANKSEEQRKNIIKIARPIIIPISMCDLPGPGTDR